MVGGELRVETGSESENAERDQRVRRRRRLRRLISRRVLGIRDGCIRRRRW